MTGDATLEPYIIKWAQEWMNPPLGGEGETFSSALPAGREHWGIRDTWYNLMALGYQLTGNEEFLHYGLQQARLFLETRGTNADPILEDVPLFDYYPGVASYTAQQFGHFAKALTEREQSTGQTLTVPAVTDTSLVGVPYRNNSEEDLIFHVRKAPGERVEIPFRFRTLYTPTDGIVIVEDPDGVEIVNQTITNVNNVLAYELILTEASAAGDYRVTLNSLPLGDEIITSLWPPREGMWTKVVIEPSFQATWGVRLHFKPQVSVDTNVQLYTSLRPDDFQTHRLYRPDGSTAIAQTLQLGPPHYRGETYLVGQTAVDPEDQGQLWTYTRMNGDAWLEGYIYPVVAFRPDEFFVPQRFNYKRTDLNQDGYVNVKDLAMFIAEWLQCTHPADPTCDP